jgi:hypothetical protein
MLVLHQILDKPGSSLTVILVAWVTDSGAVGNEVFDAAGGLVGPNAVTNQFSVFQPSCFQSCILHLVHTVG